MIDAFLTVDQWPEPDGEGSYILHRRGDRIAVSEVEFERLSRGGAAVLASEAAVESGAEPVEPEAEPEPVESGAAEKSTHKAPARPRKAGTVDAWRAYAKAVGVKTDGLDKAEIIAACEAAGK